MRTYNKFWRNDHKKPRNPGACLKELKSQVAATRLPKVKRANYEEQIGKDVNPCSVFEVLGDMK